MSNMNFIKKNTRKVLFGSLQLGDIFSDCGCPHMKIHRNTAGTAVNLVTGKIYDFRNNDEVVPATGTLTWEEKE